MKEKVLQKFAELYGSAEGADVYFAPGRVNLIGEHTDYNRTCISVCIDNRHLYGGEKESG